MHIYIITLQKNDTLFAEGLQLLLSNNWENRIHITAYEEIRLLSTRPDDLLIFLWTKDNEQYIFNKIETIRTTDEQPILIIVQSDIKTNQVKQLIQCGKIAVVTASLSIQELHTYINELYTGNRKWVLSSDIQTYLLEHLLVSTPALYKFDELSDKEQRILDLARKGYSIKQTAEVMHLKNTTIAQYRSKAMKKIGISSILQLQESTDVTNDASQV